MRKKVPPFSPEVRAREFGLPFSDQVFEIRGVGGVERLLDPSLPVAPRRRRVVRHDHGRPRVTRRASGLRPRCVGGGPSSATALRRQRARVPFGPRKPVCQHSLHRAPREAGIEPSVGSVGDSYDNALAETVIGLFKTEVIHRRGPWRSFEAVEFATLEWVDWFNNRRLLEPIGNIPPAEAAYYAQLEALPIAA